MHTQSKNKTWIWIGVIVVIAALGYFYVSSGSVADTTLSSSASSNAVVGVQVLNLLNQIKSLHIDSALFNDPGYRTLVDYSVTIPPVNIGRPNPFAPIPGAAAQSATH